MPTQINKGNLLKYFLLIRVIVTCWNYCYSKKCSRRFLETNINISSEGPKVGRLLTKLKQNME